MQQEHPICDVDDIDMVLYDEYVDDIDMVLYDEYDEQEQVLASVLVMNDLVLQSEESKEQQKITEQLISS